MLPTLQITKPKFLALSDSVNKLQLYSSEHSLVTSTHREIKEFILIPPYNSQLGGLCSPPPDFCGVEMFMVHLLGTDLSKVSRTFVSP